MVDYKYKDLFMQSHTDKQLKIATDDGSFVATNEDINWENFELEESLCSESELRFGSCEASMVKFQIRNAFIPLAGKWITITETLEGNVDEPFQYGRYKVLSDVPTADKEYRDITAYDSMYDIINADVSEWYNTLLPNGNGTVTLKKFRESFVAYFGLEEVVPEGGLINDSMTVERNIEPEQISGKDVITAICEINGCFGHIGRDGKFHYIYLPQNIQGIYPADFLFPNHVPEQWNYLPQAETGILYPQDPKGIKLGNGVYISCKYEDYVVRQINKLQIRQEENDIGTIHGSGDNCYIIEDNFLVYGKNANDLSKIAENVYNKITGIAYRPFECEAVGNPCLTVGDPIKFNAKYEIIESYILKRTLKGIQALRDSYSSAGSERRSEKVNGIQKSIVQLKGKSNVLERNIEETRSELKDTENNLQSEIRQTASEIRTEVKNTTDGLSTRITQNESSITAEVNRAKEEEENLSSRITINEQGINTKVTKGSVSSEISQEAGAINISANRISISSDNFSLDPDGKISATNANISGSITASSGTFDNVTINDNCTVSGQSITGTIGGGHIGYGINAGNLSTGTVGVGYSYGGTEITTGGVKSEGEIYSTSIYVSTGGVYAQRVASSGAIATVGTSTTPFAAVYASSINNTSSRETKTNINKKDSAECLSVVLDTEIVSYNYKTDIADKADAMEEIKKEKENYVNLISKMKEDKEKPSKEDYLERIQSFDDRIADIQNFNQTIPKLRYGFIAEDAPEELVTRNRKTVDIYSSIAMCFGAIQEMSKKIEELENIIKNGGNYNE